MSRRRTAKNRCPESPEGVSLSLLLITNNSRSGGRQKNQRVRKCVIQSTAAAPPTAMDDNVYSEELGGGWARCYSGHKKIAREKAIQQVDSHVLAKLLASASKPVSRLLSSLIFLSSRLPSRRNTPADGGNVWRARSPRRKRLADIVAIQMIYCRRHTRTRLPALPPPLESLKVSGFLRLQYSTVF